MTGSLVPVGVFYGSGADGVLFQRSAFAGNEEAGSHFDVRIRTDYVAPAGDPVAEMIMTAIFVTLTWDAPVTVRVTPILDDTTYDADAAFDLSMEFDLPAVTARTTRTFLVPLYKVVFDPFDGVTPVARLALRGTWVGAIVESVDTFTGYFQVDEVNVEFEPANESETPVEAA